jgi:16S rRNA U516 pseudouridylate synthase RsuA-like enzyme
LLTASHVDSLAVASQVVVNGKQLSGASAERKFYFALNKPKGFICSNKSEHEDGGEGRLVISLFDDWLARWRERQARIAAGGGERGLPPRLFTVGRLDVASVGLIFVTNDGDWAHRWDLGRRCRGARQHAARSVAPAAVSAC